MPMALALGVDVIPHLRPATAAGRSLPEQAAVFALDDAAALDAALESCTTVIQLIGTMRKRFSSGDTYESSDIATTRLLAEAARRGAVDHFVLLSSVGAGRPRGSYLQAKARAEQIVAESGIDATVLRPSSFDGEGHRPPPGMAFVTHLFGMDRFHPIAIEDLARTLLYLAFSGAARGCVLEGSSLWQQVAEANSFSAWPLSAPSVAKQ